MAVASPSLKGLSQKFGGAAPMSDFRQSASNNNSNVSKIAKDLANAVSSQKRDFSALHSSIEESLSVSSQASAKMEQTNSLLGESISLQNNMLTQLKSIANYMKKIEENGSGGLLGGIAKALGVTAGVTALGAGAGYGINKLNENKSDNSGAKSIDPSKKFGDLTEEEKTKFLEKQSKAGNIDKELNNPGGLKFNEHAKKFGAEEGPNGLAKFSSADKGKEAHRAQWESPDFSELPVGKGLDKWQGGGETKPASQEYKTSILGDPTKKQAGSEENSGEKQDKGTKDGLATIKSKGGATKVAAQYASNFQGFIDELEASGYQINHLSGFADRNIAGTSTPSWHSKGMAIDINPQTNPVTYGDPGRKPKTDMPENVGEIAAKYGLGWGGKWDGKKQDAMHFSLGEGPGATFRGQGLEAASKGKGEGGETGGQTAGGAQGGSKEDSGSKAPGPSASEEKGTPSKETSPSFNPRDLNNKFMGGKVIPFEAKKGVDNRIPAQGGILGSILSKLTSSKEQAPSKEENAPMPQTTAAQGNLAPSYAKPGSDEDTAGRLFEADKANTAKAIKEKATEEAAMRQTADEAASRKQEQQRPQQTEEPQLRQASYNPGAKSEDSAFGKGDWAGDVLRYYGLSAA